MRLLTDKSTVLKIEDIISEIESAISLQKLKGMIPLKGHKNCYRIRIGHYRLGILLQGNTVWLVRVMHRKEIYRYFP